MLLMSLRQEAEQRPRGVSAGGSEGRMTVTGARLTMSLVMAPSSSRAAISPSLL
jgi:hypothetical protein